MTPTLCTTPPIICPHAHACTITLCTTTLPSSATTSMHDPRPAYH
ncbi:hypothetical protein ID866_12641, partial [Astraeus odoratus]